MEESTAVASSIDVEQPGPDGACRSLPYGVIDPYAAEGERQLKYILNQARCRSLALVQRSTRRHQLYPAATLVRYWAGNQQVAPVAEDWWTEFKLAVPLTDIQVAEDSRTAPAPQGSLVVAGAGDRWSLGPVTGGPWLCITIGVTDQLDRCEL